MNFTRPTSLLLAGMLSLAAGLSACQNSGFTGASQTSMVADTVPGTSGRTGLAREGGGMPEGIAHYAGRYYYVHNGAATRLLQRQRFTQGYSYDGKGRIVAGDGSLVHLSDREMVTFSGDRLPTPPNVEFP